MKHRSWPATLVSIAAVVATLVGSAAAQSPAAPGPLLRLDHLNRLATESKQTMDLTMDPAMLQMAAGLLSQQAAADPAVKELIAGLKGVYVKGFEFDRDGVYTAADLEAVRAQLIGPWRRYVALQGQGQSIDVFAWHEGDIPGGLAIMVAEPRRITVVNVVGPIDLAKLGLLAGQFGIPSLPGVPALPAAR
jgi:hypothetical protein